MNFNGFARAALADGVVRTLPADVVEGYLRPFQPLDRRGVAAFYPGQITAAADYFAEVETNLGRLADRRALIFWGMQDGGFPRSDLERFEKVFPNHETIELADANHFFFEDAAQQMVRDIRAFMREARSPAGSTEQNVRQRLGDAASPVSVVRDITPRAGESGRRAPRFMPIPYYRHPS